MKKIFTTTIFLGLGFLIAISCKKSSTTPTPSSTTTTTGSTTSTPTNTTTMSLTVDGAAQSGVTASGNGSGGQYQIYASNSAFNTNVKINFLGTNPPASGTYTVIPDASGNVTPTANTCTFVYYPSYTGDSYGSSGVVTVTAGTPSNTAVFSNITVSGAAGSHTISAVFKY